MPTNIYDAADSAAAESTFESLLFIWDLREVAPVNSMSKLDEYQAKISALVPYVFQNEQVKNAVLAMRQQIAAYLVSQK